MATVVEISFGEYFYDGNGSGGSNEDTSTPDDGSSNDDGGVTSSVSDFLAILMYIHQHQTW